MTVAQVQAALKQCAENKREMERLKGELKRVGRILDVEKTRALDGWQRERTDRQARCYLWQLEQTLRQMGAQRAFWERRVAALPPLQQAIVRMRYWEDMPWRQVAQRAGYSEKHVFKLQRAALARLAEEAGA